MECIDQKVTTVDGWVKVIVILLMFTLPDLIDSAVCFYYSAQMRNFQGCQSALFLASASSITMVATAIYLYANSLSNAGLLKDSVAVLFLNDLDEQVYEIVSRLKPSWVDQLECEILQYNTTHDDPCVEIVHDDEDKSLMPIQSDLNGDNAIDGLETTPSFLREGRNGACGGSQADINCRENSTLPDMSSVLSHIENLNLQVQKLHDTIESKEDEINEMKKEIMILKSNNVSSVLTQFERLNLQTQELHDAIEILKESKDDEINDLKKEVLVLKSTIELKGSAYFHKALRRFS